MRQLMVVVAVGLVLGRRFVAGAWLAGLAVLESYAAPAAKLVLERPRPSVGRDTHHHRRRDVVPLGPRDRGGHRRRWRWLLVTFGLVRSQRSSGGSRSARGRRR